MNRGTTWTQDMENTLVQMINLNMTIDDIANIMGRTTSSILSRINIINKKKEQQNTAINVILDSPSPSPSPSPSTSESNNQPLIDPVLHIGQTVPTTSNNKQVNFDNII